MYRDILGLRASPFLKKYSGTIIMDVSRRSFLGIALGSIGTSGSGNEPSAAGDANDPRYKSVCQVQRMIDRTPDGGVLVMPIGMQAELSSLIITRSITIDFRGCIISSNRADSDLLTFKGTFSDLPDIRSVKISNGNLLITFDKEVIDLVRLDWIKLISDRIEPQVGHSFYVRCGFSCQVLYIDGLDVGVGCPEGITVGDAFRAFRYSRMVAKLIGGTFVGKDDQSSILPTSRLIVFEGLVNPIVETVIVTGGAQPGIVFYSCVKGSAQQCHALNLGDKLGVGFASLNSVNTRIENCSSYATRHLADSNANSVRALGQPASYGLDVDLCVEGCFSEAASTSALTTHGPTMGAKFKNERVFAADKVIGVRGINPSFSDIYARKCELGIQVVTETSAARFSRLIFEELSGQVLVCDSGRGKNRGFLGHNIVENSIFRFYCSKGGSAIVPIIAVGAVLLFRDTIFDYLGDNPIPIIDQYGGGLIRFERCTFTAIDSNQNHQVMTKRTQSRRLVEFEQCTFTNIQSNVM